VMLREADWATNGTVSHIPSLLVAQSASRNITLSVTRDSSTMNARSAKHQLASNRSLQIPKYRVQSSLRLRPAPKQQQQPHEANQQVQQQLKAVMMPEPVQAYACISQSSRLTVCQPSDTTPHHRVYMTVKPTDVDMYGVVTNTMYPEYMFTARAAIGASVGLSMEVLMERYNIMMATTSFTVNFKSPLQHGDQFFVESVPCEVKGATFKFKERVVRVSNSGEQVAAEGLATCVALVPGYPPVKPARIPAPMKEAMMQCIAANAAAPAVN